MSTSKILFCGCFPWGRRGSDDDNEEHRCNSDTVVVNCNKSEIVVIEPDPHFEKVKPVGAGNTISTGQASDSEFDSLCIPAQVEHPTDDSDPAASDLLLAGPSDLHGSNDVAPFRPCSDPRLSSRTASSSNGTTYASASSTSPGGLMPGSPPTLSEAGQLDPDPASPAPAPASHYLHDSSEPLVLLEPPDPRAVRIDPEAFRVRDVQEIHRQRYSSAASLAASQAMRQQPAAAAAAGDTAEAQHSSFSSLLADGSSANSQSQHSLKPHRPPLSRPNSQLNGFTSQQSFRASVPQLPPPPPRMGPLPPLQFDRSRYSGFGAPTPRPLPDLTSSDRHALPFLDSQLPEQHSGGSLTAAIPGSLPSMTQGSHTTGGLLQGLTSGPASGNGSGLRRSSECMSSLAALGGLHAGLQQVSPPHEEHGGGPECLSRFAPQHHRGKEPNHHHHHHHHHQGAGTGMGMRTAGSGAGDGMEPWTPETTGRGAAAGGGRVRSMEASPFESRGTPHGRLSSGTGAAADPEPSPRVDRYLPVYYSSGYSSTTASPPPPLGLQLIEPLPASSTLTHAALEGRRSGAGVAAGRRLETALSGLGSSNGRGSGLGGMAQPSPRASPLAAPPPMLLHSRSSAPSHVFAASAYESPVAATPAITSASVTAPKPPPLRLASVPLSPRPQPPLSRMLSPARLQEGGRESRLEHRSNSPLTPELKDQAANQGWLSAAAPPPSASASVAHVEGAAGGGGCSSGGGRAAGEPPRPLRRTPTLGQQRLEAARANEVLLAALLSGSKSAAHADTASVFTAGGPADELERFEPVQAAMGRLEGIMAGGPGTPHPPAAAAGRASSTRMLPGGGGSEVERGGWTAAAPGLASPSMRARPR